MTPTNSTLPRAFAWMALPTYVTIATALSCLSALPVQAQDAKAILQKMVETYHGLSSYQAHANITVRQVLPNGTLATEAASSTRMIYQKPNKLRMDVTMPTGGHTVSFDGVSLLIYRNRQETYTVPKTGPVSTLKDLIPALPDAKTMPQFDPLFFLAGSTLPPNIVDFVRRPDEFRNGGKVYVVSATAKNGSVSTYWTFVIDQLTYAMLRLEGKTQHAPISVNLVQSNGAVLKNVRVDMNFAENLADVKLNAAVDPSLFAYKPPRGARKLASSPGDKH